MEQQLKNTFFKTYHKGFTLIEVLVVVGVFATVIGGATTLLTMIITNNQKARKYVVMKQEGENVLAYVNRTLVTGKEVADSFGCSDEDNPVPTPTSSASITSLQDDNDTIIKTITCNENTDTVTITTATTPPTSVTLLDGTGKNLDLQNYNFLCFNNTVGSFSYNFSFRLASINGSESETFQTTATLRNVQR